MCVDILLVQMTDRRIQINITSERSQDGSLCRTDRFVVDETGRIGGQASPFRVLLSARLMSNLGLVLGALLVVLIWYLWKGLKYLTWRPYVITEAFRKQGVRGPAYRFWSGSLGEIRSISKAAMEQILDVKSHDISTRVQPFYRKWTSEYGQTPSSLPQILHNLFVSSTVMLKRIKSSMWISYVAALIVDPLFFKQANHSCFGLDQSQGFASATRS